MNILDAIALGGQENEEIERSCSLKLGIESKYAVAECLRPNVKLKRKRQGIREKVREKIRVLIGNIVLSFVRIFGAEPSSSVSWEILYLDLARGKPQNSIVYLTFTLSMIDRLSIAHKKAFIVHLKTRFKITGAFPP